MHKIVATSAVALSLALPVTAPTAAQAEYPEQPVEFVVPFPPAPAAPVPSSAWIAVFAPCFSVELRLCYVGWPLLPTSLVAWLGWA